MSSASVSFRPPLSRLFQAACRHLFLALACLSVAGASRLAAQTPGTQDTSFVSAVIDGNIYAQALQYVNGAPLLFVGGDQDNLDDLDANGLADPGFILPDFGNTIRIVYTAVPELIPHSTTDSSHYLLVGGLFGRSATQIKDNQPGQNLVRLSPLGALDTTFNPGGKGADGEVTAILPLPDGGSVVGGQFQNYNLQPHEYIVRLNSQGTVESNGVFNPTLSFDGTVLSLAAQQNPASTALLPQVLVAGLFSNVNGVSHAKLARINADGTVDGSFNPSFDDRTTVVVSQPDGKILVGGDFSHVNGTPAEHLVRLNFDGSIDPTFTASVTTQPAGLVDPPAVYVIQLLDNGSMYLGGNFAKVNGVKRNFLARVDANGVLDTAFDPGKTILNAVQSISIQTDGRLLVGENVSKSLDNSSTRPPSLIRVFAEPPVIALVASVPNAVTGTPTTRQDGAFTLTRSGSAFNAGALTVYVRLNGSALPKYTSSQGATSTTSKGNYLFDALGFSGQINTEKRSFMQSLSRRV